MGGIRPLPLAGGGSYSEPAVFSHFPDFNFFFFLEGGEWPPFTPGTHPGRDGPVSMH